MPKARLDRTAVFQDILRGITGPEAEPPATSAVSLDDVGFNPNQPRRYHDPEAHAALVGSIQAHGVIQPILVRRTLEGFEVIAGERRARAARDAGLSEIPAVVLDVDDTTAMEIATLENMAREDLNPVEETEAVLRLLAVKLALPRERVVYLLRMLRNEESGRSSFSGVGARERATIEGVFKAIGRFSVASFVTNRLPLLSLPADLLEAVAAGRVPYRTVKPLAAVSDAVLRTRLLARVIDGRLTKEQAAGLVRDASASESRDPGGDPWGERFRWVARRAAKLDPDRGRRVQQLLAELKTLLDDQD
ncbi:MAG TPA: ParB/RepB/Spo0J family partition protein [Deinococcales bacterium]|nr:ParB/RepB/Spo0J family partition protein [Deinococcales bacterium]